MRGLGTVTKLGDGRFRARIYILGRQQSKVLSTHALATKWLKLQADRKVALEAGAPDPGLHGQRLTYEQFAPELVRWWEAGTERVYTASTLDNYRRELATLLQVWGPRAIVQTRASDVDDYVAKLRADGLSTSRISHLLDRLAQLHALSVRRGYLARVPCAIRRPRTLLRSQPEVVSDETLDAILAQELEPRARLVVLLAADAGLRPGEIVRLRGEDVSLRRRRITVAVRSESDRPKSGRARVVPILTARLMRALVEAQPRDGRYVVPNIGGKKTVFNLAQRATAPVAGERSLLRALRHRFATWLGEQGVQTRMIQAWLGHATILTTERYLHEHRDADAVESLVARLRDTDKTRAPEADSPVYGLHAEP